MVGLAVAGGRGARRAGGRRARRATAAPAGACRGTLVPAYVAPAELLGPGRRPAPAAHRRGQPGERAGDGAVGRLRRGRRARAGGRRCGCSATWPRATGRAPAADVAADVDRYARVVRRRRDLPRRDGPHRRPGRALPRRWRRGRARLGRALRGHERGRRARAAGTSTWPTSWSPSRGRWRSTRPRWRARRRGCRRRRPPTSSTRPRGRRRWPRRARRTSGARWVYVTSGTLPNPWQTVPDYFEEEEALLEGCAA